MTGNRYRTLEHASLRDSTVHALMSLAKVTKPTREELTEAIALALANEKAELLIELQRFIEKASPISALSAKGETRRFEPRANVFTDPDPWAIALLMRELVCEQVYRERQSFDVEHPCRALKLRKITPDHVCQHADNSILSMTNEELKAHASRILDRILASRGER